MKKISFIDYIALIVFSINLLPPIKNFLTNGALLSLIILWVIINLPKIIRYKGGALIWIVVLLTWLVLGSGISLINGNIEVLKNYVFELLSLVFPFIVFCIRYDHIMKNSRFFMTSITVIIVASNIINIFINQFMQKTIFFRTVESYTIVYITVIFSLITLYKIITPGFLNSRKHLIIEWIVLIICVFNILTSGYTIANFILLCGVGILLINKIQKRKQLIKIFTVIIIFTVCFIYLDNIFEVLLKNIQNPIYYQRIYDIYAYLNGNDTYSTLTARLDMYNKSISAFIAHPLAGNIWYLNAAEEVKTVVGYHSTTLDNFGLFGLIGGCFSIYILFYPLMWLLHRISVNKAFVHIIILVFFLIITINNQIPGIGAICYFYLPLLVIDNKNACLNTKTE